MNSVVFAWYDGRQVFIVCVVRTSQCVRIFILVHAGQGNPSWDIYDLGNQHGISSGLGLSSRELGASWSASKDPATSDASAPAHVITT